VPADALDAAVLIQDGRWTDALPTVDEVARRAALGAWAALPPGARAHAPAGAEVSVVLADDARVQELNRIYRGQDKPTNVLSFANLEDVHAPDLPDGEPVLLGDVVLARETVLAEARAQGKTPGDHLSHLCVHGLLHLLGYDHMADAEAETMEALERRVLAGLGIADPYALAASTAEPQHTAAGGGS
jgi:probable rRNA maturation factor